MARQAQPKDPEGRQYRFEVSVTWTSGRNSQEPKVQRTIIRNNSGYGQTRVYHSLSPVKSAITRIKNYYLDRDPHATFDIKVFYVDLDDWHVREDVSGSTLVISETEDIEESLGLRQFSHIAADGTDVLVGES